MIENKLSHFYKHIDNGGIWIEIKEEIDDKDENIKQILIELSTPYFGYPYIITQLRGLEVTKEDLEKIGLTFLEAANKLKDRNNI